MVSSPQWTACIVRANEHVLHFFLSADLPYPPRPADGVSNRLSIKLSCKDLYHNILVSLFSRSTLKLINSNWSQWCETSKQIVIIIQPGQIEAEKQYKVYWQPFRTDSSKVTWSKSTWCGGWYDGSSGKDIPNIYRSGWSAWYKVLWTPFSRHTGIWWPRQQTSIRSDLQWKFVKLSIAWRWLNNWVRERLREFAG